MVSFPASPNAVFSPSLSEALRNISSAPSPPSTLIEQLAPGGRLVIPIATDGADLLTVFRRLEGDLDPKTGAGLEQTVIGPCRFVPLIGSEGYPK